MTSVSVVSLVTAAHDAEATISSSLKLRFVDLTFTNVCQLPTSSHISPSSLTEAAASMSCLTTHSSAMSRPDTSAGGAVTSSSHAAGCTTADSFGSRTLRRRRHAGCEKIAPYQLYESQVSIVARAHAGGNTRRDADVNQQEAKLVGIVYIED